MLDRTDEKNWELAMYLIYRVKHVRIVMNIISLMAEGHEQDRESFQHVDRLNATFY